GVLLGTAVLGRQNYLLVLPCLLTLLIWDARIWARNLFLISVLCAATTAVVAPVFLIWGGLVPPKFASFDEGISVWNGVLTMGYAGLIGFLIAPDIIRGGTQYLFATFVVAIAIWLLTGTPIMPMQTALPALFGKLGTNLVASLFGLLMSL